MKWVAGQKHSVENDNRVIHSIPSSYTVYLNGDTYFAEANNPGGTDYDGSSASIVIQAAVDALTAGDIVFKPGEYLFDAEVKLKNYITLRGAGRRATTFIPTENINLLTIQPTSGSWIYNVKVEDIGFKDVDEVQNGKAGIFLNNKGGNIGDSDFRHLYFEKMWNCISTSTTVDNNAYLLHECTFDRIMFESPRNQAMLIYNSIDQEMQNLFVGIHETDSADPMIQVEFPVLTSSGAHLSNISVLNVGAASTTSDAFYFKLVAEIYAERLIADAVTGRGFVIENCTRSYYDNLFALSVGSHGLYVTGDSETVRCDNVISQSNGGYGIVCDSSSPTPNYFLRVYTDGNHEGETALRDIDTLEHLKSYISHNRMLIPNNLALRFEDSGGMPQAVLSLGGDDILRLTNPIANKDLHVGNSMDGGDIYIGYDTTGDIAIGTHATTKPPHVSVDCATDIILKHNANNRFTVGDTSLNCAVGLIGTTADMTTSYKVNGTKVVGAQQAAIADIGGGGEDSDGTARDKIDAILTVLRTHGFIASS